MKIAIILGSHRRNGKNKEIEDMLIGLKYIFQKFVMTGYSFDAVNYEYINNCPNANEKYNYDICEYIKSIAVSL